MKSNVKNHGKRNAAILLVATAGAMGIAGVPAAAAAPTSYVALSVGFVSENPPVQMAGGRGIGPTEKEAYIASLDNCQRNRGHGCVTKVIARNTCAAIAANDFGETATATGLMKQVGARAMFFLQNQQGAHVVKSGCAN